MLKELTSTLRQFARDMHAVSKRIYRAYHAPMVWGIEEDTALCLKQ